MTVHRPFIAAAVQLPANAIASQARDAVTAAADRGAELIVLPELFAVRYDPGPGSIEQAEPMDGPTVATLTGWSRALATKPVLVTSILERNPAGRPFDTGVVVDHNGLAGSQRKIHLWGDEARWFAGGDAVAPVSTRLGSIGIAICYDAGFPEVCRRHARQGADILAVPAAFGAARRYAWCILTRSRALENGCVLIAAGLCGTGPRGREFAGASRIVDPFGEIRAELANDEGLTIADIQPAHIAMARDRIPYLTDLTLI
ncbi:MAG: carbon-nitrogen hydrolase family protein [Mycobacterium sp.]